MTKKYAHDVIAPCVILDKHTGERVVIDHIERIEDTDSLLFMGYFDGDSNGEPYDRVMDDDSVIRMVEDA